MWNVHVYDNEDELFIITLGCQCYFEGKTKTDRYVNKAYTFFDEDQYYTCLNCQTPFPKHIVDFMQVYAALQGLTWENAKRG